MCTRIVAAVARGGRHALPALGLPALQHMCTATPCALLPIPQPSPTFTPLSSILYTYGPPPPRRHLRPPSRPQASRATSTTYRFLPPKSPPKTPAPHARLHLHPPHTRSITRAPPLPPPTPTIPPLLQPLLRTDDPSILPHLAPTIPPALLTSEALQPLIPALHPTALVNLLYLLTTHAPSSTPSYTALLTEISQSLYSDLQELSPVHLVTMLQALASHPPAYIPELFAAATEFVWDVRELLAPRELVAVSAAYAAVLHYEDDEDFFDGIAAEAVEKLQAFPPSELAALLAAFSRLQHYHPRLLDAAVAHCTANLQDYTLADASKFLRAAVHLNHPLPQLWGSVEGWAVQAAKRGEGSPEVLADLAWGVGVGGQGRRGSLLYAIRKGLMGGDPAQLEGGMLADLFEAQTQVELVVAEGGQKGRPSLLPEGWLPYCFTAWALRRARAPPPAPFNTWRFRDQPELASRGGFVEAVKQVLQAAGTPYGPPELTEDGLLEVPLPLQHTLRRTALEPLPPSDCSRNPPFHPTGPAAARVRTLARHGWVVVPVPWHDWGQLGSHKARAAWVLERVRQVKGAPGGEGGGHSKL